ncbi:LysE family translocator [Hahella sp. SMD15-11]|uniref:LysE family translocator n=1 Tax=Thermohahella caldifontis TaxID=3142973 RepID=A0AB39UT32_9GAMM
MESPASLASLITPVTLFALATCGSPGPNNMLLTASGARFGYRGSLGTLAGIFAGFGCLLMLAALGLGTLFELWPPLQWLLRLAGAAYLVWLAWKLGVAGVLHADTERARAVSPFQACLLQFVNPKGLTMAMGVISAFALPGEAFWSSVALIVTIMLSMLILTGHAWILFGQALVRLCRTPRHVRRVNVTLALLTLSSVIFILN